MEGMTVRLANKDQIPLDHILFEPMGKNTAPAVALLCHVLQSRGRGDDVVGLFPADHYIGRPEIFQRAIRLAEKIAKEKKIVTLGLQPNYPATGYGYIQRGDTILGKEGDLTAFALTAFKEKPDAVKAEQYINSGNFFWNAGIFVFSVNHMAELFQKLQPQIWEKITRIDADLKNAEYHYALLPSISLDYAIMEKTSDNAVIPCEMGWSDVGSWDEVARLAEDAKNIHSVSMAEIFSIDSANNYVFSVSGKVVGLVGVQDLLIVETPDAVLVSKRKQSQKVKDLVDQLKEAGVTQATIHPFETRPWGRFEILSDEATFKAKKITVDRGAQLSYQSHDQRSEHWVIVSGKAEVTINDNVKQFSPGESVLIPSKTKHRMKNVGDEPLVFIEIQTGAYFGEDDIVRYKDDYGRTLSEQKR